MSRSVETQVPAVKQSGRIFGAVVLGIAATVFGILSFGEASLAGLAWGPGGLVQTAAWNPESPVSLAVAFVYLAVAVGLLALVAVTCLKGPRKLRGLALVVCSASVGLILIVGAVTLSPASVWI